MAAHPRVVASAVALGACWGNVAPPPPVVPPALVPAIAVRPRGLVIVSHVATGSRDPMLFWNDLDGGATGQLNHDLTRHLPAITSAKHAAWFANADEVLRVSRPAKGPGIVVTELTTDKVSAVNHNATRAVIACASGVPCEIGKLTDTGVLDEHPVGTKLPYEDGIELEAWLPDGRLVYQQKGVSPTIWYVDPASDKATRGLRLRTPFSSIADDGSLIAWQVTLGPGKQVVRWKRVRDEHEMSLEIAGVSIDCRFTPVTRQLYCVVAPGRRPSRGDDDVTRNHLLIIDPANGKSRELAGDLPLLDTHFTSPSPDGRYVAYTAFVEEAQRPMIVDVYSGEVFPIGPAGAYAFVLGWLSPR